MWPFELLWNFKSLYYSFISNASISYFTVSSQDELLKSLLATEVAC